MSVPLIQQLRVGSYVVSQRLKGVKRYPLVLMLEPLFRCNLACPGCGKIDYEDDILNRRLSVAECIQAVEECGAPVVSIPGGEPLLHRDMQKIVEEIVAKFLGVETDFDRVGTDKRAAEDASRQLRQVPALQGLECDGRNFCRRRDLPKRDAAAFPRLFQLGSEFTHKRTFC